jgi:Fe-S cluster biogenesis protein NfuA
LERVLGIVNDAGDGALPIRQALLDDGVVSSLLLIHGLYPISLEDRVMEALDSVRPFLASHGGDVEFVGIDDGVARLRLQGSCDGCPASAATLEHALKEAIDATAPDLLGLEVEGVVGLKEQAEEPAGLSLPVVQIGAPTLPMADSPYTECPSGVGK